MWTGNGGRWLTRESIVRFSYESPGAGRVEKGALIKSLIESAILSNDILEELHKKRKKKHWRPASFCCVTQLPSESDLGIPLLS